MYMYMYVLDVCVYMLPIIEMLGRDYDFRFAVVETSLVVIKSIVAATLFHECL